VPDTVDSALTARLRQVLASGGVTESELRELTGQAAGWQRALEGQIAAGEQRLSQLSSDPGSSIIEIADELRRVESLRPELAEVRGLLAELESRARELRAAWLRAATDA
jgi:phage-related minor tail protein